MESNNSIDDEDGLSFINEMSVNEFLFSEIFQSNNRFKSSMGFYSLPLSNNIFNFIPEYNNDVQGMSIKKERRDR